MQLAPPGATLARSEAQLRAEEYEATVEIAALQARAIIRRAIRVGRDSGRSSGRISLTPIRSSSIQFSKRLAAFCANAKFELPEEGRTLAKTVKEMRDDFGLGGG